MATRFYFGVQAPPVSPAFDASWETTTSAIRRLLEPWKDASIAAEQSSLTATTNSPAGAVDRLLAQYTSAPLDVNQTITGTVKGQIKAQESNLAADLRAQVLIWTMKSDGTSRGTNLAHDTAALSSEFGTGGAPGQGNRKFPRGGAITLTSVAALAGDRLVIEIGFRKHESATTSRTGTIRVGNHNNTGNDLAENETDVTDDTPWIEFSQNLTFTQAFARATQIFEESLTDRDSYARASQIFEESLTDSTSYARLTQLYIEILCGEKAEAHPLVDIVSLGLD